MVLIDRRGAHGKGSTGRRSSRARGAYAVTGTDTRRRDVLGGRNKSRVTIGDYKGVLYAVFIPRIFRGNFTPKRIFPKDRGCNLKTFASLYSKL